MTLSNEFNRYSNEWREIKRVLTEKRASLIESLVAGDDDQIRGRIKMIDDIIDLDKDPLPEPPELNY